MKKKKKKSSPLLTVLIILFAGIFLFSAYKLWGILREYKAGENVYDNVTNEVATIKESKTEVSGTMTVVERENELPIEIDFEALCAQYPDVVGWIYSPDTVINYPVVQGDDNDYYLDHLVNGDYNGSGSIFLDMRNLPDLSDQNSILYGHHMKNGSMFRSIVEYESQEYYEEHPTLYFLTPEKNYRVEVFAGYVTPSTSDTYTFNFAGEEEFAAYLEDAISRSDFDAKAEVTAEDKILTLSTCTYAYDEARYVLQGKLVELPAETKE